ncbi:hypothetical protein K438DRAFT_1981533 [Mycena galopus ATCC 62051]|nr:hypothetical protein K438DRAFT_1981533 [Mycena galopus ATCC 62051]
MLISSPPAFYVLRAFQHRHPHPASQAVCTRRWDTADAVQDIVWKSDSFDPQRRDAPVALKRRTEQETQVLSIVNPPWSVSRLSHRNRDLRAPCKIEITIAAAGARRFFALHIPVSNYTTVLPPPKILHDMQQALQQEDYALHPHANIDLRHTSSATSPRFQRRRRSLAALSSQSSLSMQGRLQQQPFYRPPPPETAPCPRCRCRASHIVCSPASPKQHAIECISPHQRPREPAATQEAPTPEPSSPPLPLLLPLVAGVRGVSQSIAPRLVETPMPAPPRNKHGN